MENARFVLQVEENLTQEERDALQYLLADALSDFRIAREKGDAAEYVRKRYPEIYPEGTPRFNRKVREVEARIGLARKLHNAALRVEVQSLKEWLGQGQGLRVGLRVGDRLHLDSYEELIGQVREEFGDEMVAVAMDCFTPDGPPVEPGYEDSCSFYVYEGV